MSDTKRKEKFPSTFTITSSTAELAKYEVKLPVGSKETLNEKDDLYNPFDHRQPEHPNSSMGSLIHLLKSSLGTGILAMPNAFKNGGLLFGFVGTIIVGFLCTHCVHILVKASHEICRRSKSPALGFSETAEAVFKHGPKSLQGWAPYAKVFVEVSLVLTYYMGGAVYVVFISTSIKRLVDFYYPEIADWSVLWYMLFILVPLIITCQIRELKYLVPFSFMANIFMVISFGITLYYMFTDIKYDPDKTNLFSSFNQLPLFFSTVIFAMEGIGVVMPVENQMKKPEQFLGCPGVLNIAMSTVVLLYAVIGFFGYLKYVDGTQGSVTFNLPTNEIPAQVVQVLIALSVFFTYSLQFYVPMDITWRHLENRVPLKYHNLTQVALRTLIVAAVTGIAALVPDLEPIIGLVGSICFSTLGIFIPAVVETVLCWDGQLGVCNWKLYKNIFLAFFAVLALVSGTYASILEFIRD